MGSNLNFKNMGDGPPESNGGGSGAGGGRAPGIFPLARQTSIYSLTFDEFQNSMGGVGKDFGSMNMDELLRNIWTAEEAQVMGMASASFGGSDGGVPGANLQRQGSLTLPRTLSTKTVDEVWRDLYKESGGGCGSGGGGSSGGGKDENVVVNGGTGLQQRQQTLGEMTLEDFLVRAGVVREETQSVGRPNSNGFYGELYSTNNNGSLGLGFGQPNRANGIGVSRVIENNNPLTNQNPTLGINLNGTITSQQQQNRQPQQILPKQTPVPYASPLNLANNSQLANQGMGGGVVGLGETMMTNGFVQGGGGGRVGGGGVGGLGAGAVTIATVTPANPPSSNGFGKINGNNSTLLPGPYVFNGTLRGKRSGAVEKVVERRQRRMIKNRESAARSRARKQAYTMELEEEVAKLKEENQELQKKQAETMEMQKQALEMMNQKAGAKRRCLRRTLTGPW